MIEPPKDGTESILTLRLSTAEGPFNLVYVYGPTLHSPAETKDQFYESLDAVVSNIPTSEHVLILGDFNARVGADHESWHHPSDDGVDLHTRSDAKFFDLSRLKAKTMVRTVLLREMLFPDAAAFKSY